MQYGYTRKLEEFAAACPKGRVLGIDPGSTVIGLALSDDTRLIATPFISLNRTKWSKDLEAIGKVVSENKVSGIAVGYPINMDGTEGPRCQSVRQMAKNLVEAFSIPILLWDERLSTSAVTRMMIDEGDLSRARRAELVDKLAASYMLQGALDGLKLLSA